MSDAVRTDPGSDRTERWGFARLTRRAEFQRVSKGLRSQSACFTLQGASRNGATGDGATGDGAPRIGITVTRKVGGAVERNRIRRRLRAALAVAAPRDTGSAHDYVIVARRDALAADFSGLRADLARAFDALETRLRSRRPAGQRRTPRDGAAPPRTT